MMEFPEFVLIARHSIGMGPWWDRDKMTQTESVSVSQHVAVLVYGIDSNFDVNGDLIPGSGRADEDWF